MNGSCARCGQPFQCGLIAGDKNPCWCTLVPPVALSAGTPSSCLCPSCLALQPPQYPDGEMREFTWRLWIAYDGTRYCGWQFQPERETVEAMLKRALLQLTKQDVALTVAGRTDAGVHAHGQVVSCRFMSRFNESKLIIAFASALPKDISVWLADVMHEGFDARRHAVGKRYVYRIRQSLAHDPFSHRTSWHVRKPLDVQAMQQAAQHLVGDLDYESFRSGQCEARHARRTIWRFDVSSDMAQIEFDIRGNAFCHNQIRIMVGTLVDVGLGKFTPDDVKNILEGRDRSLAGKTAPPHGLSLDRVYYPDYLGDAQIPQGARFPRYPVTKETWPWQVEEPGEG
jgi:tRNA pseudouridine38-40 synthase